MADEWYYSRNGKQSGPVALDQLKQLLSSGQLSGDELVWNASMTEWTPARQVPGLTTSTHTLAPGGSLLSYEAPSMASLQATPRSIELLRQTRPWVRLVSILMFIAVAFNVLFTLVFTLVGMGARAGMAGGIMMIPTIVATLLYIVPAIFLWQYASNIAQLQFTHRSEQLEAALSSQKSFWKFIGILIVIGLAIAIVFILLAILAAVLSS